MVTILPHITTLGALGCLVTIVTAFATPDWAYNPEIDFRTGLHIYCNGTRCYGYGKEDKYGWFAAVHAFMWICILTFFFALVFNTTYSYYTLKNGDDINALGIAHALVFTIAGIPGIIAMAIFSSFCHHPYIYGYSYWLGWTACLLCYTILALILAVMATKAACKHSEVNSAEENHYNL
ncbi:uncharacterized protein LOC104265840 [Ciona intestinalis]